MVWLKQPPGKLFNKETAYLSVDIKLT